MARSADAIEREIEKARDALSSTLDELSVKADPKKLADSAKSGLVSTLNKPQVKYPLIGIGVVVGALLLRKLLR